MLKKTLTLFTAIVGIQAMQAQCSMYIPQFPGYTKITSNMSLDAIEEGVYWVCDGVQLTINSSPGAAFFLEKNVTLIINGSDGDGIWAKDGCKVVNNSTTEIAVYGNPLKLTLNNNSSGTIVNFPCSDIYYDYSLALWDRCPSATGVEETKNTGVTSVLLSSNPAMASFQITISGYNNPYTLAIYNIFGQQIKRMENILPGITEIAKDGFDSGIYLYSLLNGNEIISSGKLVIN